MIIGLLFIDGSDQDKMHIILNMSQLTNKVHKLLFSIDAMDGILSHGSHGRSKPS